MKKYILIALAIPAVSFAMAQNKLQNVDALLSQDESILHYQTRYPLTDPYKKLVDNQGNGFEALYGVRNMRAVLNGIVYRGGANNAYNKYGKRNNSNPLPTMGLQNLCKEGFSNAIYLYSTNYSSAPKNTSCSSAVAGGSNQLGYMQESVLLSDSAVKRVLNLIYNKLSQGGDSRPLYIHCWNGWHASGFISAVTLRQFCDYSGEQAVNYWNINTDGNNKGSSYDKIRSKIRAYSPDPNMRISAALKAKICPVAR